MAKCHHCQAELSGQVNYWHQDITPTDNQNSRENIKFPISWSSVMRSFCSASCLSDYVKKYSGETISQAKLDGTPQNNGIIDVLKEPYKHNNKLKQQLNQEGFKKLSVKNDADKGDGRKQVGLATPEEETSQKPVFDKLKDLKNKQNMETQAKTIVQCDNCKASLGNKDEKGNNIKATLTSPSTQKNQTYHYCDEECLRQHLNGRAKRKKSKASILEIEIPVEKA